MRFRSKRTEDILHDYQDYFGGLTSRWNTGFALFEIKEVRKWLTRKKRPQVMTSM